MGVSHSGISSARGVSHSDVSWLQFHRKRSFLNIKLQSVINIGQFLCKLKLNALNFLPQCLVSWSHTKNMYNRLKKLSVAMWYNFFCNSDDMSLWILPKTHDPPLCDTPDDILKMKHLSMAALPHNCSHSSKHKQTQTVLLSFQPQFLAVYWHVFHTSIFWLLKYVFTNKLNHWVSVNFMGILFI